MIIKALLENTTNDPTFLTEHGLSLYIEANGHKILFDMGPSSAFVHNAQKLGVDLGQVDIAMLSHAHYDHSGGLKTFLSINQKALVYLRPEAFAEYMHGDRYIGLDQTLQGNPRLTYFYGNLQLDDGLELLTGEGRPYIHPIDPDGLSVRRNDTLVPEDFRHEQYLLITENGKRVLISGCSHKGIVNITSWFHPDVLVGGFHFMNLDPQGSGKAALDTAAKELLSFDTVYYTCHCTGEKQYRYLKQEMNDQLHYLACGQEITL